MQRDCRLYAKHCGFHWKIEDSSRQCGDQIQLQKVQTHHQQEHAPDPVSIQAEKYRGSLYNAPCLLCKRIFMSSSAYDEHLCRGVDADQPRRPGHPQYKKLMAQLQGIETSPQSDENMLLPLYAQVLSPQQYNLTPYKTDYVVICAICHCDLLLSQYHEHECNISRRQLLLWPEAIHTALKQRLSIKRR
ncbi:hypothetical protein MP228_010842 [Amoeboaphelidium protococcarum]|nr:hypothetical protein MP228_010842 [Amoeboaphelidium protococcarum]